MYSNNLISNSQNIIDNKLSLIIIFTFAGEVNILLLNGGIA